MLAVGEHVCADWDPSWVRLVTGLAGGLGDTQLEMCGALSGGALVIGGLHGRQDLGQDDQLALDQVARYRRRFLREFGTTQCAALRKRIDARDDIDSCAGLVERATAVLLEIIAGSSPDPSPSEACRGGEDG